LGRKKGSGWKIEDEMDYWKWNKLRMEWKCLGIEILVMRNGRLQSCEPFCRLHQLGLRKIGEGNIAGKRTKRRGICAENV
jgi:hypothetical protein